MISMIYLINFVRDLEKINHVLDQMIFLIISNYKLKQRYKQKNFISNFYETFGGQGIILLFNQVFI